jgi:hypothetical protein
MAALLAACVLPLAGCSEAHSTEEAVRTTVEQSVVTRGPFTITQLEMPYRACGKPQRLGSSIYTTVSRGVDLGDSLIRYDLETGETETVLEAPDPEVIGWFVVNDDWLVWSVGMELRARCIQTGEEQIVSTSRDLYAPSLNGDLLVWDDLGEGRRHQIVYRDLRAQETTIVAPVVLADLYNNFPVWSGSRILWTDVFDGTGHYRFYDTETGELADYALSEESYRYPGYARAVGERLYSLNFDNVDVWDWHLQRLGCYSTIDRCFTPIVADGVVVNYFETTEDLVATVDENSRLVVRFADELGVQSREYEPVGGPIDWIQSSADGTLIAARGSVDTTERCMLYMIEVR